MQQIIYNLDLNLFHGSASGSNGKWFPLLHPRVTFTNDSTHLKRILDRNSEYKLIAIQASETIKVNGYQLGYVPLYPPQDLSLGLIAEHCDIYDFKITPVSRSEFSKQCQHVYITNR
jgi:hypothetical protein